MHTLLNIKKYLLFSVLLIFLFSCKQENPDRLLNDLNGYWEIDKVTLENGQTKQYKISTLIDFIEIKNMRGIRKKVAPQINGNFKTTHASETLEISIENQQIYLLYATAFNQWKETLIDVNKEQLILKNEAGTVYTYKRYKPINLSP